MGKNIRNCTLKAKAWSGPCGTLQLSSIFQIPNTAHKRVGAFTYRTCDQRHILLAVWLDMSESYVTDWPQRGPRMLAVIQTTWLTGPWFKPHVVAFSYLFLFFLCMNFHCCVCCFPLLQPSIVDILNVGWWATTVAWWVLFISTVPLNIFFKGNIYLIGWFFALIFTSALRSILHQLLVSITFPNFLHAGEFLSESVTSELSDGSQN